MSASNEENHFLKKLRKCSNDQTFHFSEGNLSNSNDIINSLDQIQWTNLTSLDLSSNKLRDITLLTYADKLEILNLSNNFLNNVSSVIGCKSLISLDISKNDIHELPELNRLPFLEKLNASHNPLASISGKLMLPVFNFFQKMVTLKVTLTYNINNVTINLRNCEINCIFD